MSTHKERSLLKSGSRATNSCAGSHKTDDGCVDCAPDRLERTLLHGIDRVIDALRISAAGGSPRRTGTQPAGGRPPKRAASAPRRGLFPLGYPRGRMLVP